MSFSQANIGLLMQNYALEEPFFFFSKQDQQLLKALDDHALRLNFPTVKKDVGRVLTFFTQLLNPTRIFEFGSGYGHSAFWYLVANTSKLKEVHLTEKRDDLETVFHSLEWKQQWKDKLCYHQGDAFESLDKLEGEFDLVLVDGIKAQYQTFLNTIYPRLSSNGVIIVDNCFWYGKFLDPEQAHKKSPQAIAKLHEWLKTQELYDVCFIPMSDGLFFLKKR